MKITEPRHIAISAILLICLIIFISRCRHQYNNTSDALQQKPEAQVVIEKLKHAFTQLPSDTSTIAIRDSTGMIQLISVGSKKVALFRHDNNLFIFTSNQRYAELLRASQVQPLSLQKH